jgi:hypothetical protein
MPKFKGQMKSKIQILETLAFGFCHFRKAEKHHAESISASIFPEVIRPDPETSSR